MLVLFYASKTWKCGQKQCLFVNFWLEISRHIMRNFSFKQENGWCHIRIGTKQTINNDFMSQRIVCSFLVYHIYCCFTCKEFSIRWTSWFAGKAPSCHRKWNFVCYKKSKKQLCLTLFDMRKLTKRSQSFPSLNKMNVGKASIWYLLARLGYFSVSIFTTAILSFSVSLTSLSIGTISWHGPHLQKKTQKNNSVTVLVLSLEIRILWPETS